MPETSAQKYVNYFHPCILIMSDEFGMTFTGTSLIDKNYFPCDKHIICPVQSTMQKMLVYSICSVNYCSGSCYFHRITKSQDIKN